MKLHHCSSHDHKAYLRFVKSVYSRYPNYKDSSTPVLKQFLHKKGPFCENLEIMPIIVKNETAITAVCMYIISERYEGVLQVAFFEALENSQAAVDLIMAEAKALCRERHLDKITVGLNGHVNYGIGFLCDMFDATVSFGSSFTPPYYKDYFLAYNPKSHEMVSFCGSIDKLDFKKHIELIGRADLGYNYRQISFRQFRRDMKIYTDLNNICFAQHPFYFQRTYEEDHALFKELRYFIREENLIFIQQGDIPVGYMLWYPDFNEYVGPGKSIGISAYIRNKLFPKGVKKMKIVEIAILPAYQNSGAIVGLFNECYKICAGRYTAYETSWVFKENYRSRKFGEKLLEHEYKHYVAYEITLSEEL